LQVVNISGQIQLRKTITSKIQTINISQLRPGIYFIRGEKQDQKIIEKFIKL